MSLTSICTSTMTHPLHGEMRQEPIESLPPEIMLKIFSYLRPEELGKCGRVSRAWKALASDDTLWKALHPAIAFGRKEWETYFGDVGREPALPRDIYAILQSPCPFWPHKRIRETHLLILIPQIINGCPLTMKSLRELVKSSLKGARTQYRGLHLGEYCDPPAAASHWVLMTKDVLPRSRNKSYVDQQALVAQHAKYQVPNLLEATVCIFMEHARSGSRLYSDTPWTFTMCQEKWSVDWQLSVGGFSSSGLYVCRNVNCDYAGVGALRKL